MRGGVRMEKCEEGMRGGVRAEVWENADEL